MDTPTPVAFDKARERPGDDDSPGFGSLRTAELSARIEAGDLPPTPPLPPSP